LPAFVLRSFFKQFGGLRADKAGCNSLIKNLITDALGQKHKITLLIQSLTGGSETSQESGLALTAARSARR
jgi:hypothetical protein